MGSMDLITFSEELLLHFVSIYTKEGESSQISSNYKLN
jgi:hypothetical protein